MRKAVVLEIRKEYAAVLTDEGLVQKIPDRNYQIGQEIVLPAASGRKERKGTVHRPRIAPWYRAAAAAAVILAVSGGGLYYASENAFAYSTVTVTSEDISMELKLNKKDEVVAVKALDEKSRTTVSGLHISAARRRPLPDTLDLIAEDGKEMRVTVASGSEEHRQKLEKEVTELLPTFTMMDEFIPEPAAVPDSNAYREKREPGSEIFSMENSQDGGILQQNTNSVENTDEEEDAPAAGAMIPSEENTPEQNRPSGQIRESEPDMPYEQPMQPEQGVSNGQDTLPAYDMPAGQREPFGQNVLPGQGMPPAADRMPGQDAGPFADMGPAF